MMTFRKIVPPPTRLAVVGLLALDAPCLAGEQLEITPWSAVPFGLLLLAIAVLPMVAGTWWHWQRHKALVVAALALPVVGYLAVLGEPGLVALEHTFAEYVSFICLLTALYIIAGGIVIRGDIPGHPRTNTFILGLGTLLANVVGTTGASMILIRPVLRINSQRQRTQHIPVFFIFSVSNLGGLLTPLGDPPLFLGFLKGVPFFWTVQLWQPWIVANGVVLGIFYIWDRQAYARETAAAIQRDETTLHPLRFSGLWVNLCFLAVVVGAVLWQAPQVGAALGVNVVLRRPWPEILMLASAGLAFVLTPKHHHHANQFTWGPILEVALLFAGIFATIPPALHLLATHGAALGITQPWQYFWLSGSLSSVLDNAPTYVTFGTLAAGGNDFALLAGNHERVLAALSCGAVFMGANTYIGNGPNFMVKALAEEAGYAMPTFFGYVVRYVVPVLLPIYVVVTLLYFL